jgi:hypothetical protein
MTEEWAKWEKEVINGVFPLHRAVSFSDHSAVFLTEYQPLNLPHALLKLVPAIPTLRQIQLAQWSAAASLAHPNLIRLLEAGHCQLGGLQFLFVVMEYAELTLEKILSQHAVAPEALLKGLRPILASLSFLHGQQLVQGGLKPSNILLVNQQLKLASDTVRASGESTASIAGSSVYDPPESSDGSFSTAGDIWSLGVFMVEALTQCRPSWPDRHSAAAVLPDTLPPQFVQIVRRCLSRNPAHRPTVAELEAQIDSLPQTSVRLAAARRAAVRQAPVPHTPVRHAPMLQTLVPNRSGSDTLGSDPLEPHTPMPHAAVLDTPVLHTLVPNRPGPDTLWPPTPMPHAPALDTSMPHTPMPHAPVLDTSMPHAPMPHAPAPDTPDWHTPDTDKAVGKALVGDTLVAEALVAEVLAAGTSVAGTPTTGATLAAARYPVLSPPRFPILLPAEPADPIPPQLEDEEPALATVVLPAPKQRSFVPAGAAILVVGIAVWTGLRLLGSQAHSIPTASTTATAQSPASATAAPLGASTDSLPERSIAALPERSAAVLPERSAALPNGSNGAHSYVSTTTPSETPTASLDPGSAESQTVATPSSVIHEEAPDVPIGALETIRGHIKFAVRVTVDGSGNVVQARLINHSPSKYFTRLAIESARKWKFVAADNPVSRQWLLRFEFTRDGATAHANNPPTSRTDRSYRKTGAEQMRQAKIG